MRRIANFILDWHKHGSVQVLIIVDGKAYYQERGKEAVIYPLAMAYIEVTMAERIGRIWA